MPSRLPTRSTCGPSTHAMNRLSAPVRTSRLADSCVCCASISRWGTETSRSKAMRDRDVEATDSTGPAS